jgi:hemolysin III
MIFVLLAGTYAPFALLVLHGAVALGILVVVWTGALSGLVFKLAWISEPRWVAVAIYIALGWAAVAALPPLPAAIGVVGLAVLARGGVLYTLGWLIYAIGRPGPAPPVFGFHTAFHLPFIIASVLQYSVVAFWVLP